MLDASVTFTARRLLQGRPGGREQTRPESSDHGASSPWCRRLIHTCGQHLRPRDQEGMTHRATYGPLCGFNQLFTTRARLYYIKVEM